MLLPPLLIIHELCDFEVAATFNIALSNLECAVLELTHGALIAPHQTLSLVASLQHTIN